MTGDPAAPLSLGPPATGTTTLVVNPSSGKGRALELLPRVVARLRDAGIDPKICLTRDFADARALTLGVVAAGIDSLVVMGGDGIMHLGINACAGTSTTLGLVPAGTGNDLCRGIGLDPDDAEAAAGVVADGRSAALDLIGVAGGYVGAVLATGFDALVNRRANELPWPRGSLRYPVATLSELRVFSPLHYILTIDGVRRDLRAMLVAIGNTTSYGGGMRICPDADASDGLLDLTIVHPVSRLKLVQLLPQMYSGRFVRDPAVEQLRAREVILEGVGLVGFGDGEMIGAAPMTATAAPGAVRVYVPPQRR